MDTITPQSWTYIGIAVVLALLAVAAWSYYRNKQSDRLKKQFGAEYGRTVDDLGSRAKAESDLKARENRVEHLAIVALAPAEVQRFSLAWAALQGRFVDNPKGVVAQADQLVRDVMAKRGYPVEDFEHRAADISVNHPSVVEHYRAAQAIAVRDGRGEADTEEQRQAVVHYRALFDELLEVRGVAQPLPVPAPQLTARA